jgi:hypothetical protein
MKASLVNLIVVGGVVGSGKTTLITGLYELLRRGPFAGLAFAGSKSLLGFEQRCHLGRASSGLIVPDTERTKVEAEDVLLHLRLRQTQQDSIVRDILIADLSGETFRAIRQSSSEAASNPLLDRMDRFVLTIDGAALADPAKRQYAANDATALLRSLTEAGKLNSHTCLDIVVTRIDLVPKGEGMQAFNSFRDSLIEKIRQRHAGGVNEFTAAEVAVRPEGPPLKFGHGLDNVVSRWVRPPFAASNFVLSYDPINPKDVERQIDRLLFK